MDITILDQNKFFLLNIAINYSNTIFVLLLLLLLFLCLFSFHLVQYIRFFISLNLFHFTFSRIFFRAIFK